MIKIKKDYNFKLMLILVSVFFLYPKACAASGDYYSLRVPVGQMETYKKARDIMRQRHKGQPSAVSTAISERSALKVNTAFKKVFADFKKAQKKLSEGRKADACHLYVFAEAGVERENFTPEEDRVFRAKLTDGHIDIAHLKQNSERMIADFWKKHKKELIEEIRKYCEEELQHIGAIEPSNSFLLAREQLLIQLAFRREDSFERFLSDMILPQGIIEQFMLLDFIKPGKNKEDMNINASQEVVPEVIEVVSSGKQDSPAKKLNKGLRANQFAGHATPVVNVANLLLGLKLVSEQDIIDAGLKVESGNTRENITIEKPGQAVRYRRYLEDTDDEIDYMDEHLMEILRNEPTYDDKLWYKIGCIDHQYTGEDEDKDEKIIEAGLMIPMKIMSQSRGYEDGIFDFGRRGKFFDPQDYEYSLEGPVDLSQAIFLINQSVIPKIQKKIAKLLKCPEFDTRVKNVMQRIVPFNERLGIDKAFSLLTETSLGQAILREQIKIINEINKGVKNLRNPKKVKSSL